jgi:hypothetical protein
VDVVVNPPIPIVRVKKWRPFTDLYFWSHLEVYPKRFRTLVFMYIIASDSFLVSRSLIVLAFRSKSLSSKPAQLAGPKAAIKEGLEHV